jgi:ketosteroid isomerase-like protein
MKAPTSDCSLPCGEMPSNVDAVREATDAFLSGNLKRARELTDPGIVCVRPPPFPDPQTYHGFDGVVAMWGDWTGEFEDFEMESLGFEDLGDRVLAEVVQRGRGKASGVTVVGRFWFLYALAGGKVTRLEAYLTREQALG